MMERKPQLIADRKLDIGLQQSIMLLFREGGRKMSFLFNGKSLQIPWLGNSPLADCFVASEVLRRRQAGGHSELGKGGKHTGDSRATEVPGPRRR